MQRIYATQSLRAVASLRTSASLLPSITRASSSAANPPPKDPSPAANNASTPPPPISSFSKMPPVNSSFLNNAEISAAQAKNQGQSQSQSGSQSKGSTNWDYTQKKKKGGRERFLWAAAGAFFATAVGYFAYELGRPDDDQPVDEYSKDALPIAFYNRAAKRIDNFIKYFTEPSSDLLLPPPLPAPYQRPYTLVIELDETLVHSTWSRETGWRTVKRPGVDYFLTYLSEFYEIVIFSQQTHMYAQPIIDLLDPRGAVTYRLFRDSTRYENGKYYKDLTRLNRDLSKVILIEKDPTTTNERENLINIAPWKGDKDDTELLALLPFLETLAMSGVPDIRPILKGYEGLHIPSAFQENLQKQRQARAEQARASKAKASGGFFRGGSTGGQNVDLLDRQAEQHQKFIQIIQQQKTPGPPQQVPVPPATQPDPQSQQQPADPAQKAGGIWGWFQGK